MSTLTPLKLFIAFLCPFISLSLHGNECDNWELSHPEWIWCDSFELSTPLTDRYEDVNTNGLGRSINDKFDGLASLKQSYVTGQVDAGWIIKVINEGFPEHIFYRWYHKFESGYTSFPPKMARAGYRDRSNWTKVFFVHNWISNAQPTLDVFASNSSQGRWLPVANSGFDLQSHLNEWVMFEVEIKLNTPGQSDGLYRLWINDELYVDRSNIDLRGNTTDRINEIMLDTYWNEGATGNLGRYYDNFVISTEKIGAFTASISPPSPPTNFTAK